MILSVVSFKFSYKCTEISLWNCEYFLWLDSIFIVAIVFDEQKTAHTYISGQDIWCNSFLSLFLTLVFPTSLPSSFPPSFPLPLPPSPPPSLPTSFPPSLLPKVQKHYFLNHYKLFKIFGALMYQNMKWTHMKVPTVGLKWRRGVLPKLSLILLFVCFFPHKNNRSLYIGNYNLFCNFNCTLRSKYCKDIRACGG